MEDELAPPADAGLVVLMPALSEGLAALPAGQREVLLLHAWADLSHAEKAQALSISVGTARKRLHRARASLTDRLPAPDHTTAGVSFARED